MQDAKLMFFACTATPRCGTLYESVLSVSMGGSGRDEQDII
jgi:hypothetical protein